MIKIRKKESSEFFIKQNKQFLIDNGFKDSILQNDTVLLYHGTSVANSKKILSSGILKNYPFLTPDENIAKKFSKQAGSKTIVIPFIVKLSSLAITGGYFTSLNERLILNNNGIWE